MTAKGTMYYPMDDVSTMRYAPHWNAEPAAAHHGWHGDRTPAPAFRGHHGRFSGSTEMDILRDRVKAMNFGGKVPLHQ